MCLAVAAQVTDLSDHVATVTIDGVGCQVSSLLVPDLKRGEWVLVHAGFAMQRIDERQATEVDAFLREMAETEW